MPLALSVGDDDDDDDAVVLVVVVTCLDNWQSELPHTSDHSGGA